MNSSTLSWTSGVRREVLPNGLTLLVQRDDSAPAVAVVTHVKAGFFDEPDRWQGISHVLEHMYFKGTARRGVGQIARETKAAGGYLNAGTSYDYTTYYVVLPASGLSEALDIQSDALRNSVIDAGELERELQVIIQEARRKLDTPDAVTYETLNELMFDRHRIRRWRIGYAEQLAGFGREDVWGYYRSRYVPARTVVAIVGAIDPDQALELGRRAYGEWEPGPWEEDRSPEEPAHREVRTRTLRGDVTRAELALGWPTVPPLDPASPALDLAAAVLSAGRGSWLYRALREPGLVTSVSAHNYAPTEVGVFGITAELEPERVGSVLEQIGLVVGRLAHYGPTVADLDRARTLLLTRWARQMESMDGRASALAQAEALAGIGYLDREYAALQRVTADEVRRAAERFLVPDGVAAVVYLPNGRGDDLTTAGLTHAFAVQATPLEVSGKSVLPPVPPAAGARVVAEAAGIHRVELPGADLLVRRKAGVPLATIGIYRARPESDPPERAGLAALVARSSVRGAGELETGALAFAFEQLGGTLSPGITSDWLGFGTTVLAERLPEAGALLDLVSREPHLGESGVETERRLMLSEAEQVADDMFRFPFQLAFAAAFGPQGYGLPVGGLPETLPRITIADARRWHERLQAARPAVIVVGDVDPDRASDQLAGIFGSYPGASAVAAPATQEWWPKGVPLEKSVQRDKAQSAFAMVFPGPDRRAESRQVAEVWAAVASGLGGRLFEALRDQRSLAYTVLAAAWQRRRAGALVSYIATSPEREEEARAAMLEELATFAREPVSPQELSQAIGYLSGQAQVRRQSGAAVAGEILDAWLVGTGLDELADPAARYHTVTAGQIEELARRWLDPERRAEGLVRGSAGR